VKFYGEIVATMPEEQRIEILIDIKNGDRVRAIKRWHMSDRTLPLAEIERRVKQVEKSLPREI
jgi:hypothetical protein